MVHHRMPGLLQALGRGAREATGQALEAKAGDAALGLRGFIKDGAFFSALATQSVRQGGAGSSAAAAAAAAAAPAAAEGRIAQRALRRTFASKQQQQQPPPPPPPPPGSPASNPSTRAPVNYVSLALTMATGTGLLMYYRHVKEKQLEAMRGKEQQVAGAAMVGGPFEMVDTAGQRFTNDDLKGEFAALYFGFTYCPDICPDELEKLAAAIDLVEERTGARVVPVFLSIDPERDSVKQVAEYVKEFHPRMVGLTGTPEQARAAARAYRVYYSRTNDSPDDYLVDHSIITYLVAPDGSFVTFYGNNFEAPEMGASMAGHVAAWADAHPDYRAKLISAHAEKKREEGKGEKKAGGKPEAGAKEA